MQTTQLHVVIIQNSTKRIDPILRLVGGRRPHLVGALGYVLGHHRSPYKYIQLSYIWLLARIERNESNETNQTNRTKRIERNEWKRNERIETNQIENFQLFWQS